MMDIKSKSRLPRTTESKIFETVTALLLLLFWALTLRLYLNSPDVIPTHFDIDGTPNGYGGRGDLILIGVVGTFSALLFTIGSYFPKWLINVPVRIDTPRKTLIMARMARVLSIEMIFFFAAIVLAMNYKIDTNVSLSVMLAVIFATILGFCIAAVRSK